MTSDTPRLTARSRRVHGLQVVGAGPAVVAQTRTPRSIHAPPGIYASMPSNGGNTPRTKEVPAPGAIRVSTLGRFSVRLVALCGQSPDWRDGRTRLLMKCLLAAPSYRLAREQLIDILWPEQDAQRGREFLRHALSRLRRALEPEREAYDTSSVVGADRESVWLHVDPRDGDVPPALWVDRMHFEHLAREAIGLLQSGHGAEAVRRGREIGDRALDLHEGPFLPTDLYADWAQGARRRCAQLWAALVRSLAARAVAEGRLERALLLLGQLFDVFPTDEDAAARLMHVQAASGHRGEALRTYEALRRALADQLGGSPTRELQDLERTIRTSSSQAELIERAAVTFR